MKLLQKRFCCLVKKSEDTALGSAIRQAVWSYSKIGLLWNTVPAEKGMSDTPKMQKIRTPTMRKKSIEAALHKNEGIQFK